MNLVGSSIFFRIILDEQRLKIAIMFIIGKNSKSEESGGIAEGSVGYLSINTEEFNIDKYRYG